MESIYRLIFHPGEVTEIRAVGVSGKRSGWEGFARETVSGYFNDAAKFATAGQVLDNAKARGVYFVLNPVNPALLARAANRLKVPRSTTQDQDIICIRWLPIDLDPKRPADISATNEELALAMQLGKEIAQWLEGELGFAKGLRAESGNGCHLLYRLPDLPNNEQTHDLIVRAIAAIRERFKDWLDRVDIDDKVVNPARLWKLYGTTGRKGDDIPERPHRQSRLFPGQPGRLEDVHICGRDLLEKLADLAPNLRQDQRRLSAPPLQEEDNATRFPPSTLGPLKVENYLADHGIGFRIKQKGAQTLYILDKCLFNPDHGPGEACIIAYPNGPLTYQCFHASCSGKTWRDARQAISGDKPIAKWCAGYDPDWEPPTTTVKSSLREIHLKFDQAVESQAAVDPPEKINPLEFFEQRGKRLVFFPQYLVKYLAVYLAPLFCTSGRFWRYDPSGVWKSFPTTKIRQIIAIALKERIQSEYMKNTLTILEAVCNRDEHDWPNNPKLLNLKNGILNVWTMEFVPHDPKYGMRTMLPVSYNKKAYSERWEIFLKEVFPDDKDYSIRGFLQEYLGYCLLRDCRYEALLFLYGTGSNGKSTILKVLTAVLGTDNVSSLSLKDLSDKYKPQFLEGKMANISTETGVGRQTETEMLKKIISGELITVERKYDPPYQFSPYAKFIISLNDLPNFKDKSYGLKRRILSLPFNRRFSKEEISARQRELNGKKMEDYLCEELDGIFNWILEGTSRLIRNNGFSIPDEVKKLTENMAECSNPLLTFAKEFLEIKPELSVETVKLYELYKQWCQEGENRPLGRNQFLLGMCQTFPSVSKGQDRQTYNRVLRGIGMTQYAKEWFSERIHRYSTAYNY